MTFDPTFDNDWEFRRREKPNISEEAKQKYFFNNNSYARFRTVPSYIKPLVIAGTFAGVCVQDIRSKITLGYIIQISYVVFIAGLFGMMAVLQLAEFYEDLKNGTGLLIKLACITMFCSDVFTLVAIVYMLFHNAHLNEFFNHYQKVMYKLYDYTVIGDSTRFLMVLYGVYLSLTVLSSVGISVSFWMNGNNMSLFLFDQIGEWQTMKYFGLLFYLLKPIIVMIAWSYVEVTLAIFAFWLCTLFQRVSTKVNQAMDKFEEKENQMNSNFHTMNLEKGGKEKENIVIEELLQIDSRNRNEEIKYIETDADMVPPHIENKDQKNIHDNQDITIEDICDLTLKSMEDHYQLSELTRRLSRIFGPLLLFDLCLYLFIITALLYGTVKGIGLKETPVDVVLAIDNISYLIRLFLIIPVYSRVHRSSNEIVLTYTRVMSVCPEALTHRISLYIQQLGNNPVGISAAGFFIVTLGTLLTFWGSVITYLVVLFKNAAEDS